MLQTLWCTLFIDFGNVCAIQTWPVLMNVTDNIRYTSLVSRISHPFGNIQTCFIGIQTLTYAIQKMLSCILVIHINDVQIWERFSYDRQDINILLIIYLYRLKNTMHSHNYHLSRVVTLLVSYQIRLSAQYPRHLCIRSWHDALDRKSWRNSVCLSVDQIYQDNTWSDSKNCILILYFHLHANEQLDRGGWPVIIVNIHDVSILIDRFMHIPGWTLCALI